MRLALTNDEDKFKYMLTQEFDFSEENKENPNLKIDMRPDANIRPHQEKALNRMFHGGRARSGIIVLPCGAGKTFVGIGAVCRIKKRTLILCINSTTVKQWRSQILQFSNVGESKIF